MQVVAITNSLAPRRYKLSLDYFLTASSLLAGAFLPFESFPEYRRLAVANIAQSQQLLSELLLGLKFDAVNLQTQSNK